MIWLLCGAFTRTRLITTRLVLSSRQAARFLANPASEPGWLMVSAALPIICRPLWFSHRDGRQSRRLRHCLLACGAVDFCRQSTPALPCAAWAIRCSILIIPLVSTRDIGERCWILCRSSTRKTSNALGIRRRRLVSLSTKWRFGCRAACRSLWICPAKRKRLWTCTVRKFQNAEPLPQVRC